MNWGLLVLGLPGLIFLLAFYYAPLFGLIIPFKRLNYAKGIWGSDWVGFKNFEFFFKSQDAVRVTRNTLGLNLSFIVFTLILAVTLALLLFSLSRKKVKIYQTAMFIPYFISWVVASYVLYALQNPVSGLLPNGLKQIGIELPNIYATPKYWPFILSASYIWKNVGYMTLLFYTALMGIDATQFEAAAIDGANALQITFRISIPFLVPVITLLAILQIGKIFYSDFGMFYFLTRDSGPIYSTTDVIDTYVYRALRLTGDIGMASAAGLYQSVMGFAAVLCSNLIVRRINRESAIF
ncbi:MAG: ABC transporter permease subunit [Spirochaetaceae bacterium]|jgi:putative aldouronate transport system permease protein|nr:ABC transporter permease subunit [Spirochaetaceae bacterium]